jgi:DNA polymerase I-like protein with 3'-5' exonuclease and polymerase domains
VVDFETTTVDFGTPHSSQNSILLATWINGPTHPRPGKFSCIGSEVDMADLVYDVEAADFLVAAHAKFELGWLERCGLELGSVVTFCTHIAERVIAGNRQWRISLDACLERRGWASKDPIGKLIRWDWDTRSIPTPWLLSYCASDTRKTENLMLDQVKTLHAAAQLPVTFTRNILTPVLYDIERYGLHLDRERVDQVYQYYVTREEELSIRFAEISGGCNPKSTKQKKELLFDRMGFKVPQVRGKEQLTGKGEPKTDVATLKLLKCKTKEQREILDVLGELTSTRDALSKYVTSLKVSADLGQPITADFSQVIAQTHRLTSRGRSTGIQLQNFQRRFRPVVKARTPGWRIGDGDAAGLEFRTATDFAKDDTALGDIASGADVHAQTARVVFAGQWDESIGPKEGANDRLRTAAKASTFKPLYGGSSGSKTEREYYDAFKERYSGIADMQAGWTKTVLKTKQLTIPSGLIFYWPNCELTNSGYITYSTQIYDYPIQSFATADLAPTATVYLWHYMKAAKMQSFLINIVHDSAVGELHPDEADLWSAMLAECFNVNTVWYFKHVYNYDWTCPLATEVKLHDSWGYYKGWEDQWNLEEDTNNA